MKANPVNNADPSHYSSLAHLLLSLYSIPKATEKLSLYISHAQQALTRLNNSPYFKPQAKLSLDSRHANPRGRW